MFVGRSAAGLAAAMTHLPSVDGVIFTDGIGVHASSVSNRIRARLHLAGERGVDTAVGADSITRSTDVPAILRIAAREDLVIADAVVALVDRG